MQENVKGIYLISILKLIMLNVYVWLLSTAMFFTVYGQPRPSSLTCVSPLRIRIVEECGPGSKNEHNETDIPCITPVRDVPPCQKQMNITVIDIPPFSDELFPNLFLTKVLPSCCGKCASFSISNQLSSFHIFYESHQENHGDLAYKIPQLNATNIVYPLFGDASNHRLHGYFYLPLFELTEAMLITRPRESDDLILTLLSGVMSIWPLLLICLLMAAISGFIAWCLETWGNSEEFRRPFFQGLFDGFWWSFVSMTTVGYGDKSPKSISARIFSIAWILCGITICSMFTATLTNVITSSISPTPPIIASRTVGVLKGRLFDLHIVVANGGNLIEKGTVNELLQMLDDETIDGVVLDSFTTMFNVKGREYITTQVPKTGKTYSYGIGFTDLADLEFFGEILKDNKLLVETCLSFSSGSLNTVESTSNVFSPDGGMFYPYFGTCVVLIFLILIFGVIFEIRRKKKKNLVDEKGIGEKNADPHTSSNANDGVDNAIFHGPYVTAPGQRKMMLATHYSAS